MSKKKIRTITFQPDEDIWPLLEEAKRRDHGVLTEVINQALRDCLALVLTRLEEYRTGKRTFADSR